MAETEVAAPATPATAKKSKSDAKPRKPKTAPSHPKVAEMVNTAIEDLRDKGGSSLQAIKKYIAANYKVDIERISPFVRRYLKTAVVSGALVQTKGKGASGSFRISTPQSTKAPKSPRLAANARPKKEAPKAKKVKKVAPKSIVKKTSPKKLKAKPAAAKKPKAAAKPKKTKSAAKKASKKK